MVDDAELSILRSSIRASLAQDWPWPPADHPTPWRSTWPAVARLGVPALTLDVMSNDDASVRAAVVAASEFGRALHPADLPGMLAATAILSNCPTESAAALLAQIVEGTAVATALDGRDLEVVERADGCSLSGATTLTVGATELTHLVVTVGDACFLVRDDPDQIGFDFMPSLDTSRYLGHVTVTDCPAERLPVSVDSAMVAAQTRTLRCADSAAVIAKAMELTVAYAKERETFGTSIGKYQAVQHRLVEHTIASRQMDLLIDRAAYLLDLGAAEAIEASLSAQTFVLRRASHIVSDCIQLSGAIGFTWEYGLHFLQRRAIANEQLSGGVRGARQLLIDTKGWAGVA